MLETAIHDLADAIRVLAAAMDSQSTTPETEKPAAPGPKAAPIATPTPPAEAATAPRGRGRPKAPPAPAPVPEKPIEPFFKDAEVNGAVVGGADPFGDDEGGSTTGENGDDLFAEEAEAPLPATRETVDQLFRDILSLETTHPGSRAEAMEILKRYGAAKISQLQPAQFPAVIKDCQFLIRKTNKG